MKSGPKTLKVKVRREKQHALKGITSDQWKNLINKFDAARMSEAHLIEMSMMQFENTLKQTMATGNFVKLHKAMTKELQTQQQERNFTDKDKVEECDATEMFELLIHVLVDTEKMDVANDFDLALLKKLFMLISTLFSMNYSEAITTAIAPTTITR